MDLSVQYGDATFGLVLEHAGIKNARVIVIGIVDAEATRKIVEVTKELNPSICIIVKVHDLQEIKGSIPWAWMK